MDDAPAVLMGHAAGEIPPVSQNSAGRLDWSGRRESNPQPTAWKITRSLKIKNICAEGAESWPYKPLSGVNPKSETGS